MTFPLLHFSAVWVPFTGQSWQDKPSDLAEDSSPWKCGMRVCGDVIICGLWLVGLLKYMTTHRKHTQRFLIDLHHDLVQIMYRQENKTRTQQNEPIFM